MSLDIILAESSYVQLLFTWDINSKLSVLIAMKSKEALLGESYFLGHFIAYIGELILYKT